MASDVEKANSVFVSVAPTSSSTETTVLSPPSDASTSKSSEVTTVTSSNSFTNSIASSSTTTTNNTATTTTKSGLRMKEGEADEDDDHNNMSNERKGWLMKRSRLSHKWKRKWFLLKNADLFYGNDPQPHQQLNVSPLPSATLQQFTSALLSPIAAYFWNVPIYIQYLHYTSIHLIVNHTTGHVKHTLTTSKVSISTDSFSVGSKITYPQPPPLPIFHDRLGHGILQTDITCCLVELGHHLLHKCFLINVALSRITCFNITGIYHHHHHHHHHHRLTSAFHASMG
ncbi:uncharacterized protein LOC106880322 isoform X1 [Octopus bimaculoides]|nr:uncharacterized protein LOC106880322 isoform X1 [Octopus bimaculoides]